MSAPSESVRYNSEKVRPLTPTYVFAKLAWARAFESPKSPSLTVLFESRKTEWYERQKKQHWECDTPLSGFKSRCKIWVLLEFTSVSKVRVIFAEAPVPEWAFG